MNTEFYRHTCTNMHLYYHFRFLLLLLVFLSFFISLYFYFWIFFTYLFLLFHFWLTFWSQFISSWLHFKTKKTYHKEQKEHKKLKYNNPELLHLCVTTRKDIWFQSSLFPEIHLNKLWWHWRSLNDIYNMHYLNVKHFWKTRTAVYSVCLWNI